MQLLFAQGPFCQSGGCAGAISQNPSTTLTPTSNWATTPWPPMTAGQYAAFAVTVGNTYEWSTCADFGGTQQNSLDAELTLYSNSWVKLCFNDNSGRSNCPYAPYIGWTATYTGTVYVLVSNAWSGQCLNSPSGQAILAYRQSASAACTGWSVSPSSQSVPASGGNYNATVYLNQGGCQYNLTFNNSWLHFISYGSNGLFNYSVDANTSGARTGTISINNFTQGINNVAMLTVNQAAATSCNYSISPSSQNYTSSSSSGSFNVTTSNGCSWNAVSNNTSWLTIISGSGTGNGAVNYSLTSNPNTTTRTGTINVTGGNTFTVTQAGTSACSYSISPTSNNSVPAAGVTNVAVSVATQTNCSWSSNNNGNTWITINSSGSGSGTALYSVSQNVGTSSRSATITIAGQSFNITQAGTSCTNSIAPTSASANPSNISSGGSSILTVNGGSLGTGALWKWYANGCGTGSSIGIGSSITVSPTSTTTYYVRAEGTCNTTSCVSITVTVAQVSVTYWIGAYTQPESYNFSEKFLLSATSNVPAVSSARICADGSKATIIKLQCDNPSLNMNDIRFKLESDPNNTNANLYGEFNSGSYFSTSNLAQVRLTHPNYLNNNQIYRDDNIIAYNTNNPSVTLVKLPIRIYHAPLLFVHGLWGDVSSFQDMDDYFRNQFGISNIITWRADYSLTNASSFASNSYVLPSNLLNTLLRARNLNFSSGKVDVICHSMGGVLSRIYLQSSSYKNDIHTLTTINTPHSGTQAANMLMSNLGIPITGLMLLNNQCVTCGAVNDLKINNPLFLNNLNGNLIKVPSLVYTSDSYNPSSPPENDWWAMWITWVANSPFFVNHANIYYPANLPYSLYNQEINDVIVPYSSQGGGVTNYQHYNQTTHTNAEKNSALFGDLKNKLGQNPQSTFYNQNGFQHSNLTMPSWWWDPLIIPYTGQSLDTIKILDPANGLTYNVGDTVSFHISRLSGHINYIGCSLNKGNQNIFNNYSNDSVLQFQYIIPTSVFGRVRALAYGLDSSGHFDYDSIFFNVNMTATINRLQLQTDSLLIPIGTYQNINVDGYYSDSIIRNISTMSGVTYTILNPNIVSLTGTNTLHANQIGTTQVIANYQGLHDTMYVTVYQAPNYNYATFTVPDNVVCGSGNVQFTDESGGNPIAWNWQFPGGTPATATSQNPLVTYSTPGKYDVTLITTWSDKIDTLHLQSYITVDTIPQVSISGNLSFCQNDSTMLIASGAASYHWSNGVNASSVVISNAGTYSVMGQSAVGCPDIKTVQVTISPLPTITLGTNFSVCSGTSSTNLIYSSTTGNPDRYNIIFDASAIAVGFVNITNAVLPSGSISLTIPANAPSATYHFSIVVMNSSTGCISSQISRTITINSIPSINSSPINQTICSETAINQIVSTNPNNVPGTTFSWTRNNTSNLTGIATNGSGTTITGTLTNITNTPQSTMFSITASADGCSSTITATVMVNPKPTINCNPISQTTCSGTAINPINITNSNNVSGTTFSWSRNNTTNVTGISANGTSAVITGTLTNATNTPQSTTFTIVASASGCSSTNTVTVTVNPTPSINTTPLSQAICSETLINQINNSNSNNVAGTTFTWTRDNINNLMGMASNGTGVSIDGTLTNVTNLYQTTVFTITASANGCSSSTTSAITVKPKPTVNSTPVNQSICSGNTISQINITNPNNVIGTIFTWTRDNLGSVTGIAGNGSGATIVGTLTNSMNTPQTTVFAITAIANNCSSLTNAAVIVKPIPSVSSNPANQTICSGTTINPILNTNPNNVAGTVFSWTRNNASIVTGLSSVGTGASIAAILNNATNTQQTTNFTIVASANGCISTTNAKVIVNPVPTINLMSSISVSQGERIRLGGTPVATGNQPFSYLWTPNFNIDYDTISNPIIRANLSKSYTLRVTDRNGCIAEKSIDVTVIGFYVYPNPTHDIVKISGSRVENGTYRISVLDMSGKILMTKQILIQFNDLNDQLSLEKFPNGPYMIVIQGSSIPQSYKIIKM